MTKRLLIPLMAALALFAIPSAALSSSHRPKAPLSGPLSGIDAGAGECDVEEHESLVDSVDLHADQPLMIALPDAGPRVCECPASVPVRSAMRSRPLCRGPPSA